MKKTYTDEEKQEKVKFKFFIFYIKIKEIEEYSINQLRKKLSKKKIK
jgi:hypothetical protein